MNNNVYKGDIQPNSKEYSVWVDSKGVIKTFDGNEWKVSSGGGIPIVDSEDKLEGLGLKQGELAVVAVDKLETKSFSELYLPIERFNTYVKPSDFELFSRVSEICVKIPNGISEGEHSIAIIMSKDFYKNHIGLFAVEVSCHDGVSVISLSDVTNLRSFDFIQCRNGEVTVNQQYIDAFNKTLSDAEYVYAGNEDTNLSVIDAGVKTVNGVQYTNLFISEGSTFNKFTTDSIINKLKNELPSVGYPVVWLTVADDTSKDIALNPCTYTNIYAGRYSSIDITLDQNEDSNNLEEFVMQIYCSEGILVSFPSRVKFQDGVAPSFANNSTVIISIVNNLAVYKEFV